MEPEVFAYNFAKEAHGDQKYGDEPYMVHLVAVRAVQHDFGVPVGSDLGVSGWLHDVLEDTKTTAAQLELSFGSTVTHLVWAVTGIGRNRKERNENAYQKMEDYPDAIPLKLADRIANGEKSAKSNPRLFAMYQAEYPAFKARLAKWTPELAPMWERLDKIFV